MDDSTAHGHGQNAPRCGDTNGRRLEPIAIVGAACRLPGEASSLHGLWDMMRNSRTAHAKVPKERWDADAWYHPDPDRKGSLNTTHGFFLQQDVGAFDAPFFSVTAKEAAGMDPTKRLLLEVAYEAFENAGLPMKDVAGSMTGVYVGSMTSDYEVLSTREIYDEPHMAAAGSSEAMTANRVSWFFDLRGPSLTLDTACSSSLYALHLACQSLRLGETNMALVAGVNVILHPNFMQQLVAMHMLSPDGISHTFDDRANGYGRGEGIGGLVVKRLADAVRDGDTIRAVIRGSGVNVDGKTPSVTMPSPEAQADLIRAVYKEAGLSLDKTQYVELHGTGTPVGDPIELSAIAGTFGACASPQKPVYVGSIKPSVGHTEGCAGLAGVFKAIMCLEKGLILPTAEVDKVNPKLRFADWNLALPGDVMSWPAPGLRRISVNSFGFGGANAHVILDDAYHYMQAHGVSGNHATVASPGRLEAQPVSSDGVVNGNGAHVNGNEDAPASVPQQKLFVLSSRDDPGISRMAKSLKDYWMSNNNTGGVVESAKYASNVAYTLAARRSLLDYRSFAVAESVAMLAQRLEKPLPRLKRSTKKNGIAFVFTGQGAQWAGMGRQLMEFTVFAGSISRSKACLDTLGCPFDLEAELAKTEHSKIGTPEYSQPICTAVQIALVDLLAEWAIRPKAVVGHSSGEIAAAYAAGILTHEDAIKVAHLRGVYSGKVSLGTRRGAMLAAGISEGEAREYLEAVPPKSVVVACVNSPKSVTLSGDAEYIDQLESSMSKDGKFARKLRVATAYHSPHMKTVADDCLDAMVKAGVGEPRETTIPIFSSVTGHLIDPVEVGKDYWLRNMCGTVRFSEAVHSLLGHDDAPGRRAARKTTVKWNALIEIGPHSALKAPLVQIMEGVDSKLPSQLPYISMLVRGEDAVTSSLTAAGHLWGLGLPISLEKVNREAAAPAKPQAVVDLPPYPWNHERRYWHEAPATKEQRLQQRSRSDLLGIAVENQNPFEPEWRNYLRVRENPWVEDHKITGTTLYPGAGMLIMVLEAVQEMAAKDMAVKIKGVEFRGVHFERGLVIPSEGATETRLRIQAPPRSESPSDHTFAVYSRTGDGSWTKHCFGAFSIVSEESGAQGGQELESLEWKTHLEAYDAMKKLPSTDVDVTKLYKSLHKVGMQYGPTFQNLTSLVSSPENGCCHGTVSIPDTKSIMPREFEFPHIIHPATLDAIFHLIVVAVANGASLTEAAVPMMLEKLFISFQLPQGAGSLFSGFSQRVERRDKQLTADLVVSDASWSEPKIIVKGLIMRQVTAGTSDPGNDGILTKTASQNKVTKMVWKRDPSSALRRSAATPSHQIRIARLRDWLELECHKSHSLRVLLVGNTLEPDVLQELDPFMTGKSPYRGLVTFIVDNSEDALQRWKMQTTGATAATRFGLVDAMPTTDEALFDLIIVGHADSAIEDSAAESSRWHSLASPKGRILVLHRNSSKGHRNGLNGCGPMPSDAVPGPVTLSLPDGTWIDVYTRQEVDSKRAGDVCLLLPSIVNTVTASLERALRDCLNKSGVTSRIVHLEDTLSLKGQRVISLLGDSFITDWNRTEFQQFQDLVSCAAHVFWITTGAHMVTPSETGLRGAPMPGLLRVLRNELPQITLAHLDLSPTFDPAKPLAGELVVDAWLASLDESATNRDLELAELNGDILVPRVVTEPLMGTEIALATSSAPPIPKLLSSSGPLRLVEGHEVAWESDDEALGALDPEHVEIKVVDISVDLTSPEARELLGSQVTGRVVRCGSDVTDFQQGHLVVALGASGVRTHLRRHQSMLLRLPESIAIEGAATAVWTFMTACYVLRHVTHLASDQNLLIQYGATSLGRALIHLALQTGRVNIFVTVTSLEQKAHLVERFRLPDETVVVVNRHHDGDRLAAYLMSKTNRQGLDVVVCSMDMAGDLVPCLSDFARVAVMSVASQSSQAPPAAILRGNLTVSTIDPVRILRETPRLVSKLLREVSELVQDDGRGLMSRTTFPIADLPDALEWMQKPEHGGIVSLHIPSSDRVSHVPVIPAPPPKLELDPDASYVLAGGLGSLGLRIADVMARGGATHLVFLSRSGGARWTERLRELNRRGCATVVLRCDVSSLTDVRNAVSKVAEVGRPIKGVIQCAMVLQDSLFETMTLDHWYTAFKPKVVGSWNLHESLPRTMDFFVMLSSVVSVIGNVSQANYAAGNAYMDALAHYRRSLGLAAVSINAGLVADSDHTIDGTAMDDYLDRFQHMASVSTTLPELDIAVIAAMRGATADGAALEPQFVFCMSDSLHPDGVDHWARDAKFSHRTASDEAAGADDSSGPSIGQALGATTSRQDAVLVVQDALKKLLAPGLGIQPADIDVDRPLYHAGVDSFKAVEIRNQVFRELKSDISVFEILSPSSLAQLSGVVVSRSQLVPQQVREAKDEP